ncbi:hypothetical protein BGZ65_002338 [Modicella reniformis]|uniref:Nucleotide exchange factor SIL1 n=1 Tax=Modicella reniformis TaxID=1440133 RepID=A0A9P6STY9_9FUNG|nr:hypothetical protein BGZ65_002338 [Modicella reniformis]
MDFVSHKKYAKLIDPEDVNEKDATNSILVVDTDTPGIFQHNVGGGSNKDGILPNMPPPIDLQPDDETDFANLEEASRMKLQTVFDSIPELVHLKDSDSQQQQQQQPKPIIPVGQQTEHQLFLEQLDIIKTSSDNERIFGALGELQDLASDMDYGLLLSAGEGLRALVNQLHCGGKTDIECENAHQIRSKAALVIGSAVQNYEKAQSAAFKANLHKFLLARLEAETDGQVLRKLIFAYGALVRGSNNEFIQDEDIVRLAAVYKESIDSEFRRKCVYIMSDFADPDMQFVRANPNDTTVTEGEDQGNHESTMTVETKERVNVGPWCETLQQEKESNKDGDDHEDWEIVERAMEVLQASYPETCIVNKNSVKDEL